MALGLDLIGNRLSVCGRDNRPVGVRVRDYRQQQLLEPHPTELSGFSSNPRNAYGDWYQAQVDALLEQNAMGSSWQRCSPIEVQQLMSGYLSPIYDSAKRPDIVLRDNRKTSFLGLELKYLHGGGSLIKPKTLADAIDFTHRPIACIYVIDGPGWLASGNVEYLARWWQFTSTAFLLQTLQSYFET